MSKHNQSIEEQSVNNERAPEYVTITRPKAWVELVNPLVEDWVNTITGDTGCITFTFVVSETVPRVYFRNKNFPVRMDTVTLTLGHDLSRTSGVTQSLPPMSDTGRLVSVMAWDGSGLLRNPLAEVGGSVTVTDFYHAVDKLQYRYTAEYPEIPAERFVNELALSRGSPVRVTFNRGSIIVGVFVGMFPAGAYLSKDDGSPFQTMRIQTPRQTIDIGHAFKVERVSGDDPALFGIDVTIDISLDDSEDRTMRVWYSHEGILLRKVRGCDTEITTTVK